jgi:hypothetical protein
MKQKIIEDLNTNIADMWGHETAQLRHTLHENSLFSDDVLANLIERMPQAVSPINTMAAEGHDVETWSYCDRSGLSGHEVLEAIKRGRLWINMQKLEEHDSRFEALLEEIYAELGHAIPGFKPFRKSLGLLISSPGAQVFYHADVPGQSLWQVRGEKRIHIYPPNEPFLRANDLENIIRGVTEEEIRYDPTYDEHAEVYDLKAGDMLHWELNGPHRVTNGDCLNVSVTTEHWTPMIRRSFAMNYGNGVLRSELGWTPKSRAISGPAFWAKVGLTAFWRKSGLQQKQSFKRVMRFRVNPNAPEGISPMSIGAAE